MNCHALQWPLAWKDAEANYAKVNEMLDRLAPEPGSLVALPEMFATGFCFDLSVVAEPERGPSLKFLQEQAIQRKIFLIGGFGGISADKRGANLAAVINPNGTLQTLYQKIHPFSFAGEHERFVAGESLGLFTAGDLRGAVFICYDLRFPEVFRAAVQAGAEFFVVLANWPASRHAHWRALLIARAIENQAYVLGVNRCGEDPKVAYAGGSLLVGPDGNVLAEATASEEILSGKLEPKLLRGQRQKFPVLRDIRWSCQRSHHPQESRCQ